MKWARWCLLHGLSWASLCAASVMSLKTQILADECRGPMDRYWVSWVLERNSTFKFKITPDRHNAIQDLVNYDLLDPPHFSLPSTFKGTVRPDWICMRVVSLESTFKGHQPLYVKKILFLILNILEDFKVLSHSMQKWIQPPASSVNGLHRILSSYWLAHCYLMKKSTKVQLFFGSDFWMMKFLNK